VFNRSCYSGDKYGYTLGPAANIKDALSASHEAFATPMKLKRFIDVNSAKDLSAQAMPDQKDGVIYFPASPQHDPECDP
jgi:hypothetical protein